MRPSNELTAALKGRIAYLPIDVKANADFVSEKLFDVSSPRHTSWRTANADE